MKKRIPCILVILAISFSIIGIAKVVDIADHTIIVPVCIGEEPALASSQEDNWSLIEQNKAMQLTSSFDRDDFQTIVDKFQSSGLDHQAVRYVELDDYLGCVFLSEAEIHNFAHQYDEGGKDQISITSAFPCVTKKTSANVTQDDDAYIAQISLTRTDIETMLQVQEESYVIQFNPENQDYSFQFVIKAKNLQSVYDEIDRRDLNGFVYRVNIRKANDDEAL